jgi:CRP-like cAMP-binding protein
VIDEAFARAALRRCALFARVNDGAFDACLARLRIRRYRRNETIFHQGDPGGTLHVIASGSVKVVLPSPDGGAHAILATLGTGEFFGELALLDGEPHSASIVALEATETLALERADFEPLLDTRADLRRALIAGLVAELRRLTGHVETLTFLDLPARLAHRIGELAAARDGGDGPSASLDWPYTQSELAGMVGGSRESVNRLLADFVARDLIRFQHDRLVVPDLERLEAEARR